MVRQKLIKNTPPLFHAHTQLLKLTQSTKATYQYDVINRLTQLTDNASLNTPFAYDATNKLTSRTLPNGVVSTYQYDGLNRLTRLTHAKALNTLLDLQYQFNAVNNITQMIDGAGTHNYSYDSLITSLPPLIRTNQMKATRTTMLEIALHITQEWGQACDFAILRVAASLTPI